MFQVRVASERRQRSLAHDIIGENMEAEKGAFGFPQEGGGEEIIEVPFVYIPNLVQKVTDLLVNNRRYLHLEQHIVHGLKKHVIQG